MFDEKETSSLRLFVIGGLVAVVGAVVIFTLAGITKIDSGNRGVEVVWGKVSNETYSEGLYFFNPISTKIIEFNTKENLVTISESAFSADVQQATISVQALVYPDRTKINEFYQTYGLDFMEKLIKPVVVGSIKEVAGKFSAVDMVTKRESLQNSLFTNIQTELEKRGITLTRLDITDLKLRDEFTQAVEAKVIAQQEAERAKNVTVRIEEEAKQKVIAAKAEAESIRIRANALSQNKALVEYEAVQKWNGVLPVYMLGNSIPMINLGNK